MSVGIVFGSVCPRSIVVVTKRQKIGAPTHTSTLSKGREFSKEKFHGMSKSLINIKKLFFLSK